MREFTENELLRWIDAATLYCSAPPIFGTSVEMAMFLQDIVKDHFRSPRDRKIELIESMMRSLLRTPEGRKKIGESRAEHDTEFILKQKIREHLDRQ